MSLPWGDLGILRAARNQEAAERQQGQEPAESHRAWGRPVFVSLSLSYSVMLSALCLCTHSSFKG